MLPSLSWRGRFPQWTATVSYFISKQKKLFRQKSRAVVKQHKKQIKNKNHAGSAAMEGVRFGFV